MNIFKILHEKRIFNVLFPLYFILQITRTVEPIKFISNVAPLFSILFIILFYNYIFEHKKLKTILVLTNTFTFWALLTLFWSSYSLITAERALLFFITSNGIILGGYHYSKINTGKPLFYLLPINTILISAALFSLITHLPAAYWSGNGYGLKSFFRHQNTLGSLIAFTMPAVFMSEKTSCKQNITISVFLILNILILLLTHSRASIAITFLAVIIYSFTVQDKKLLFAMSLFIVLFSGYLWFDKGVYKLVSSYSYKTENSLLDRKKYTILGSLDAAKEGSIFGIGYGISTPNIIIGTFTPGNRFIREKTVSVFALIEETGMLGLLLFLSTIFAIIYFLLNNNINIRYSRFLLTVIIAMMIHAQFEAWWGGVFSPQLPLFFAIWGSSISEL